MVCQTYLLIVLVIFQGEVISSLMHHWLMVGEKGALLHSRLRLVVARGRFSLVKFSILLSVVLGIIKRFLVSKQFVSFGLQFLRMRSLLPHKISLEREMLKCFQEEFKGPIFVCGHFLRLQRKERKNIALQITYTYYIRTILESVLCVCRIHECI